MNENDNSYYASQDRRIPWLKILLIIVFFIIIIILIAVIASNKNANPYDDLFNKTKIYLNSNSDKYPKAVGECKNIYLSEIEQANKSLKTCNTKNTYVKVCKLDNNEYQYTPVLSCGNINTQFNDWIIGTKTNLKQNNSDVEFRFIPEQLQNGEKIYYPNEEKNINKISTYYISSPDDGYDKIDSPTITYKWYNEVTGKDYYNDGELLPTAPNGYSNHDEKEIKKYGSLTKPSEESYRKIEEGTIYAVEYVAYPYKYECYDKKLSGTIITPTLCEKRDSQTFKNTKKVHYTCDGKKDVDQNTICKTRGEWLADSCSAKTQTQTGKTNEGYTYTRNVITGYTCIQTKGFVISDEVYKWYKEGQVKKYYPSQSTISKEENTYYSSVPTSGVMKDESSITYSYKYYKFKEDKHASSVWVSLTDRSLTLEELINTFKEAGFEVNTLEDIEKNDKIRYQIEISYRDRK